MSFKSNIRQKVEYQCNKCGKLRILFIAPALQSGKVETHGYIEYCDVHFCDKNELNAIKLFVDHNYDVRSQVAVETKSKSEEPAFTELAGLGIPVPEKTEFITQTIVPTRDFGGYNLKKIEIKDKLRQRNYVITEKEGEGGIEIVVDSPLNFVEIKVQVSAELKEDIVKEWLIGLSNIVESLVYLDENLLSYLGTYLDYMLINIPKEKELLELTLLLHSSVAIPHSTKQHIEIFEEHVTELFPDLNVVSYRMYKTILETCLENEQKTVLNFYEELKEKMTQIQAFPYYISILSTLVSFGFINLEKLEFYTAVG
ncbi:MAG: hypothetical protein ACFFDS_08645 [Candidatus Thorarchaeota archaeon]